MSKMKVVYNKDFQTWDVYTKRKWWFGWKLKHICFSRQEVESVMGEHYDYYVY